MTPKFGMLAGALLLAVAALMLTSLDANAQPLPNSCSLLTPAEIQAGIGVRPAAFVGGGAMCRSQSQAGTILLRIARRTGPPGREAAGLQIARNAGATVDVRQFGDTTCSTIVPPPAYVAQFGFNTTCAVLRHGVVAAIEVTMPSRQAMISIDRLRPLAAIIARRF